MRTYSVIRSINQKDYRGTRVVRSGLDLESARRLVGELDANEHKAHPELTSWTRDIFYCELEKPKGSP